jgi:hypothetical protein
MHPTAALASLTAGTAVAALAMLRVVARRQAPWSSPSTR